MKVESLTLLNFNRGQTIFKHLLSAFPFKKRNLFVFWIQLFWIDSDKLLLLETFLFWSSISNQVRFFIVNSLFSTLNFFINVANLRFLNCCLSFERFESCHQGKYSRKPSCRRLRVNLLAAKLITTWMTKKRNFEQGILKGEVSPYYWLPVWLVWNRMRTEIFCFYLQNRLIQTSQTGGQWYSDTSPFSIPCRYYH